MINLTSEECEDAALEIFSKAVKEGKWLIAVYRIDDKDEIVLNRVTCNFPDGSFVQCINMIKESLLEELNQKLSVKPLPLAPHLLVRDENGEEKRIDPSRVLHDEPIQESQQKAFDLGQFTGALPKKEEHNEENN